MQMEVSETFLKSYQLLDYSGSELCDKTIRLAYFLFIFTLKLYD